MIVCICHAVSDRTVRNCVDNGATTVPAVQNRTCAGTDCGSCTRDIRRLVHQRREENRRRILAPHAK